MHGCSGESWTYGESLMNSSSRPININLTWKHRLTIVGELPSYPT